MVMEKEREKKHERKFCFGTTHPPLTAILYGTVPDDGTKLSIPDHSRKNLESFFDYHLFVASSLLFFWGCLKDKGEKERKSIRGLNAAFFCQKRDTTQYNTRHTGPSFSRIHFSSKTQSKIHSTHATQPLLPLTVISCLQLLTIAKV